MTREEFKTNIFQSIWGPDFPVWDLSRQDLTDIVELVMKLAEPLFDESEDLTNRLFVKEQKILKLEDLSKFRQNEISGLQKILDEKDIEIKRLRKALEWYADKSNIENRIKEIQKHIAGDWVTISSMYDDVTKVADEALK